VGDIAQRIDDAVCRRVVRQKMLAELWLARNTFRGNFRHVDPLSLTQLD